MPHHVARDKHIQAVLARDRLGVASVTGNVLSALAPTVVVCGFIPFGIAVTGSTSLPIVMAAAALLLLLYSPGYAAMSHHVPNAGPFYAYTSAGLARPVGVGASWIAIAAYGAFQVGAYGAFGPAGAALLQHFFGLDVPWWVVSLVAWMLVAILGVLDVTIPARVMMVLAVVELALVVFFNGAITTTPDFHPSTAALSPANLVGAGAAVGFALSITSFTGFEHTANYAEEARNAKRTVWLSIVFGLGAGLLIYGGSSWVQISALTTDVAGPDLFLNEAAVALGEKARTLGLGMLLTSLFGALIAFHSVWARTVFSVARDRVLPHMLARTTIKNVPWAASLLQSALGFAVIMTWGIAGWDPQTHLFYWFGTAGGVGILALITITCLAVIGFFAQDPRGEPAWRRWIAPCLALLGLGYASYQVYDNLPVLFGVDGRTGPALITPIAIAVLGVAGTMWGLFLKAKRPEIYQGIGTGARIAARPTSQPALLADNTAATR